MGLYPDLPSARSRVLLRDALTLVLLVLFALLGLRVHHDVDHLSALGTGVADAGGAVRAGFLSAASAAGSVPLAGGPIADALRSAAGATGGDLLALGNDGVRSAHHLATVLGLLMWGLPSLLLLAFVAPRRVGEIRALRELRRAVRGPDAEARRRLLAMRAVLTVPDRTLFAYSADPAGDLLAGRYEPLAAAALATAGLRAPA